MTTQHLLFELGTEELPAKGLEKLGEVLLATIKQALAKHQLSYGDEAAYYVTPRRLAVFIADCQSEQTPQQFTRKGPKLSQAFLADGTPAPAAVGFAKSCGVELQQLDNDGECLTFSHTSAGKSTLELLPDILSQAVQQLPIARPMRWGSEAHAFARPVKWILALFGDTVIPLALFGLTAGRCSYGHRFLAPPAIEFACADREAYENRLHSAKVMASFAERGMTIEQQLRQQAEAQQGAIVGDQALLDEVTGLVEWPKALTIPFDSRFLTLPKEALIASMQGHQKCFAVEDRQQHLLPVFITITNIDGGQRVIDGNAKVMHARLTDAEFFYQQDLTIPLSHYQDTLAKMTFQQQLGSMWTKVQAIQAMSEYLAPLLGVKPEQARQAALIAKSDLCSHMVGEFPELQGVMGRAYAKAQGLSIEVADALYEQYLPRFAGDVLPATPLGVCLALADRLTTLIGIFGIGQAPTGDKDPFALRRAAVGVIRILLAQSHDLPVNQMLQQGVAIWNDLLAKPLKPSDDVQTFIFDRLRYYWLEQPVFGKAHHTIDAVLNKQQATGLLVDSQKRLQAIVTFQQTPEYASALAALASAHKRVNNFLSKGQISLTALAAVDIQPVLFEACEQTLFSQLEQVDRVVQPLLADGNYAEVLPQLAQLKEPIDTFFTEVLVLADDEAVRTNRLALLGRLRHLLNCVADLSVL